MTARLRRRLRTAVAVLVVTVLGVGAFAFATPRAFAYSQEAYGPWWALKTGYGDPNGSAFWLSILYTGTLVQNEAMQVQNLNEPEDAFDIQICSVANCETYGPYYLNYLQATEAVDVINENLAAPGYKITYTSCEYAVGCTSRVLTLFGKINTN